MIIRITKTDTSSDRGEMFLPPQLNPPNKDREIINNNAPDKGKGKSINKKDHIKTPPPKTLNLKY